jgi:hypothetical protein
MIYPYGNSTQTRWDRGELKVQLNLPNNPSPMGFCDGSPEDVAELLSNAEAGSLLRQPRARLVYEQRRHFESRELRAAIEISRRASS